MSESSWRHYLWSCGLLLLPVMAWNFFFTRYLPQALATSEFDRGIPPLLTYGENGLRWVVFVLPFLMPLEVTTLAQRRGLRLFVAGMVLYLLAWLALMLFPDSRWSTSRLGFLAPAYTPLIWLIGLGLVGRKLYWDWPYRWWCYVALAGGFIALHVTHANIVYARNH